MMGVASFAIPSSLEACLHSASSLLITAAITRIVFIVASAITSIRMPH